MMTASLSSVPDEVIQGILFYIEPTHLPAVHLTSKRLNRLANAPLLWRYHCRTQYKYWDPSHEVQERYRESVLALDWKELYAHRVRVARKTTQGLNSILASQSDRIEKYQEIVEQGYDVKDTLIDHAGTGNDVEDVLARR